MLAVELVYGHGWRRRACGNADRADAHDVARAERRGHATRPSLGSIDSGAVTYGVRVRPQHPDLPNPFAIPLVKWA